MKIGNPTRFHFYGFHDSKTRCKNNLLLEFFKRIVNFALINLNLFCDGAETGDGINHFNRLRETIVKHFVRSVNVLHNPAPKILSRNYLLVT